MAIDLRELAEPVDDEAGFLGFLAALAADWNEGRELEALKPSSPYSAGALGWENGSVGAVLDAAVRWSEASIDGHRFYDKPTNPWRRAAHILYSGKFYE